MTDKKSRFKDGFLCFTTLFMSFLGIIMSFYAISIVEGGRFMLKNLPCWMIILLGAATILFCFALYFGIKFITTPEDTRLDDLIKAVGSLKQDRNNNSNNKINME